MTNDLIFLPAPRLRGQEASNF